MSSRKSPPPSAAEAPMTEAAAAAAEEPRLRTREPALHLLQHRGQSAAKNSAVESQDPAALARIPRTSEAAQAPAAEPSTRRPAPAGHCSGRPEDRPSSAQQAASGLDPKEHPAKETVEAPAAPRTSGLP